MPAVILPEIPEYIIVHFGAPTDASAPNVQMTFVDYIKNVASSEIFPTWPENALRANILAQISFALNKIYLKWYRSQGYKFDITNDTQFDQACCYQRNIFENISQIVDEIFNQYIAHPDYVDPYFSEFCNGVNIVCPGLSQWGTVDLAEQGFSMLEILHYYYGNDVYIVENAPIKCVRESYPGKVLQLGMKGNSMRTMQLRLNEIGKNYPVIPRINLVDGIFGLDTEKAVKVFQKTFNISDNGKIDKQTWYKIIFVYNNIYKLGELVEVGLIFDDMKYGSSTRLEYGSWGTDVTICQYYLDVIGYFNQSIPLIEIDGYFGPKTLESVNAFQSSYGLTADGVIDNEDWVALLKLYRSIIDFLPVVYREKKV